MKKGLLLLLLLTALTACHGDCAPPPAAAAVPPEPPPPASLTLTVAGDLMVHREQLQGAARDGGYDFFPALEAVAGDLGEGDVAVGNLETVLAGPGPGYSGYPRFNTPDSFAQALAGSGFTLLTLANNHCLDQGESGLLRTLDTLDSLGLRHTGVQPREEAPYLLLEVRGFSVAVLSFTLGVNGNELPPGSALRINEPTEEELAELLRQMRSHQPDLVVVLPHMGEEYAAEPDSRVRRWVDGMLRNGADLVLISHPHVLQPMEIRRVEGRAALVHYSLGNLLSAQDGEGRDSGIILKLDFVREGDAVVLDRVRFVPTWVQQRDSRGSPIFRVLPIGDAVGGLAGDNPYGLSPADRDAIHRAHSRTTALYLGEAVPSREMEREYTYYTR